MLYNKTFSPVKGKENPIKPFCYIVKLNEK